MDIIWWKKYVDGLQAALTVERKAEAIPAPPEERVEVFQFPIHAFYVGVKFSSLIALTAPSTPSFVSPQLHL